MLNSDFFHIVEFFSISIVILVMYVALHSISKKIKPATKMLISMFFGVIAYSVGKTVVISMFGGEVLSASSPVF